jgi:hypothetical protein
MRVLSDCWDRAYFKALDVIDRQSGSMLLLSTRIGGLIGASASAEVKLTLMSVSESVQMLAHGAGLDSNVLSPSLLEVAKLCGRLPLTLNIASQMISDSGDDWEEE